MRRTTPNTPLGPLYGGGAVWRSAISGDADRLAGDLADLALDRRPDLGRLDPQRRPYPDQNRGDRA
jgi:hypothetical protein